MKQILTFILLLLTSNSFGQFAIVNDKDSLLNVREDSKISGKIIDKLENGHLIYCFEDNGNWTNIQYTKNNKELNGYVYKNNYKLISSLSKFTISKKIENSIKLKKDSVEVIISKSKFDKKRHKFKYNKENNIQIIGIDNQKYWGTDGEMPTTQFEKIEIIVGKKTIQLPKAALEGLYEPSIYNAVVNYDIKNDTFYIQTSNSDGAGSYLVIWKIEKGVYKDRLIALGF